MLLKSFRRRRKKLMMINPEKKLKTYQDIILQKSGQITKLEDENQKLLKEKLENIPFLEEKKKSRLLEEKLLNAERHNREHEEEKSERLIHEKQRRQEDIKNNEEMESRLKFLEKEHEQKVQKLTEDKERLEEVLQSDTLESEEKNLLDILIADVKTLKATNEKNVEKIISLQMENDKLKAEKDGGSDSLKEDILLLEKHYDELKVKCTELENENKQKDRGNDSLKQDIKLLERYTEDLKSKCMELESGYKQALGDQVPTLKETKALKEKYDALKSRKKVLKEDLKDQDDEIQKLKAKNKSLRKEVSCMTQLQVENNTSKQEVGIKARKLENVSHKKRKWEKSDDSGYENDKENWKFMNDTLDEVVEKKEKNHTMSDVSDDRDEFFDISTLIEIA